MVRKESPVRFREEAQMDAPLIIGGAHIEHRPVCKRGPQLELNPHAS